MARIIQNNYYTDAFGNRYHFNMTDHTRGPMNSVLDDICHFIETTVITALNNNTAIEFTGCLEVGGVYFYWVPRESPLFVHLDMDAQAQHPGNFLIFTVVDGNIRVTHFGPFGWEKVAKDLLRVRTAYETAKRLLQEAEKERNRMEKERAIREKEDPPLGSSSGERKKTPLSSKKDQAIAEMQIKMVIKVTQLVEREVALETAKIAAKNIAKLSAKAGVKGAVKKVPVLGAVAGAIFGGWRLLNGDVVGAGMEVASGLASMVPGAGTAASLGIDAALLGKDIYETKKKVEEEKEKQQARYNEALAEWRAENKKMIKLLEESIEEYKNAEDGCKQCMEGCEQLIKMIEKKE